MKKTLQHLALGLFCASLSSLSLASEAWIKEYKSLKQANYETLCPSEKFNNDHKRLDCIVKKNQQADQRLNQIYQDTLKSLQAEYQEEIEYLDAEQKKTLQNHPQVLRNAQNAWIKLRDNDCQLYARSTGTIGGQLLTTCELNKTLQRSAELLKIQHCSLASSPEICD